MFAQLRVVPASLIALMAGLPFSVQAATDYLVDIKPVLKERCYACHGALKQKAGLRLDTAGSILAGGKNGPVVSAGKPDGSKLIARVIHADPDERMPPEGKPLSAEVIAALREWIAQGAPIPDSEKGDNDPRSHWAFQRIDRPPVPDKSERNPIDAFLQSKRAKKSLLPQTVAERSILIRRLYIDLIGLPPSLEQLHDSRPWKEIIDELLASPHHGERWARHWMDIWRYCDWYGLGAQLRYSQKHIWRWRDWIVDSLNDDKGYDRMIMEMLAGDELAPDDPDVLRATGFLARNYYLFNRTTWLDSTIEHTGKAFLGLTLNCAKCHDHKYDPISQLDYYRFRAIFEPHQVRLDPVPGESDLDKDGLPRAFDDKPDALTNLHLRGDPNNPDKDTKIEPGVPAIFAGFAPEISPVKLPYTAYAPGARDYVQAERLKSAELRVKTAEDALARVRAADSEMQKKLAGKPSESAAEFMVTDEFDKPNEELWEINGDDWEYRDGSLHKTASNRDKHVVALRKIPPRDYEIICRYTTTSGTTYKSVGVHFDRVDAGKNQHFIYTSAYDGDPKVQLMHTVNGADQYPSAGYSKQPIKIGEEYELKFAVRGRLINVWLNGKFILAYNLPKRHLGGRIALSSFDATAAFHSLAMRALPPDFQLKKATNDTRPDETIPVAEATLQLRRAELNSVQAVVAADRARSGSAENQASLAVAAARCEAKVEIAEGKLDLLKAGGHAAKRKAAEAKIAKAEDKLAGVVEGKAEYRPLRASRKALETPAHKFNEYPAVYAGTSTGRRLALAKWVVHRDNPLTARVAVNHVWMRHFGEPLVETVADFGRRAKRPEHLELLDWLAAEFIDSEWSLRHLHTLMVTSKLYRMTSSNANADPATLAADPDNRLYWRMNPRRMESQVVRDSLLHLAGALDPTLGGPPIDPNKEGVRRSLYFRHSRDDMSKFLTMFDDADRFQCYRRTESIVPQQALALSNSKLTFEMAQKIADKLWKSQPESFIDVAFETVMGRAPDSAEREACLQFENELVALAGGEKNDKTASKIRTRLVHALLNHNDFITIR